ncbi:uncharacterized protein METZ01_LOCUS486759, partial [marine metagenome]
VSTSRAPGCWRGCSGGCRRGTSGFRRFARRRSSIARSAWLRLPASTTRAATGSAASRSISSPPGGS